MGLPREWPEVFSEMQRLLDIQADEQEQIRRRQKREALAQAARQQYGGQS